MKSKMTICTLAAMLSVGCEFSPPSTNNGKIYEMKYVPQVIEQLPVINSVGDATWIIYIDQLFPEAYIIKVRKELGKPVRGFTHSEGNFKVTKETYERYKIGDFFTCYAIECKVM